MSGAYDERKRLISIIGDARSALAQPSAGADVRLLAARVGQLEALVAMLADSAELVAKSG